MAKCKKCGKEIPKDGVCSCTVSGENVVKESGIKKIIKRDSFIEWIAVIVLILILGLIVLLAIGSPKYAAKKFAKSLTKENGGKTYFSMVYPDEYINNIKDSSYVGKHPSVKSWDDDISNYKAAKENEFSDGKLKVEKVEKISRLSTDAVNSASDYFKTKYGVQNYHCTKGYEYKITFDKDGSDTAPGYTVCVVKLKNEGWKVIEMTSEKLIEEY